MLSNKYFTREEFACSCECGFESVDAELLTVLTILRERFGTPITITSGNRCRAHNDEIGGAPESKHVKGVAADIKVKNATPHAVAECLDQLYPDKYGIGIYTSWIHIDVRKEKVRWSNV